MNSLPSSDQRIEVIDALRGFALFGLFIVHTLEHFDFMWYPETEAAWLNFLNPYVFKVVFFLFAGKAYAIFSLMFGLSFFIQMSRQAKRGVDFTGRFAWRLLILLGLGYVHGLFYCGDVLTVFAIMGVVLLLFHRLGNKALLVISLLCMVQIPFLYQLVRALMDSSYVVPASEMRNLFNEGAVYYGTGSFFDVVRHNSWNGQMAKWLFYVDYGRFLQIAALFIWGMILGRKGFFEKSGEKKKLLLTVAGASLLVFSGLYLLDSLLPLPGWSETAEEVAHNLLSSWYNIALMVLWICLFILLFHTVRGYGILNKLSPVGRMSLTCYVSGSLAGVLIFYNYGFGMYKYWGITMSFFYGLAFFTLQVLFCHWWVGRYRYGPLEWVWRALTFMTTKIPFRRS